MYAITPRRSVVPYKLHGQLWATKISEHGHYLGEQREILFHDGCIPKAPNISHTFSHSEITWTTSKWWGSHLPLHDLMRSGDALRWFHMWDYDPPPYAQIFVYMYCWVPDLYTFLSHFTLSFYLFLPLLFLNA